MPDQHIPPPVPGNNPSEAIGRLDERVTYLNTRFGNLESVVQTGFQHVDAALGQLTAQVAGTGKTNWSALGTWAAVIVAFGVAVYAPMLRSIYVLQEQVDTRVTIREHELINRFTERESDNLRRTVDHLRDTKVDKEVLTGVVRDNDSRLDDVVKRLDSLSTRLNQNSEIRVPK